MSLTPEQKKPQPAWPDLALFLGVMAFLAYSVHALLGTPGKAPAPVAAAAPQEEAPAARAPASTVVRGAGSTETLELSCLPGSASPAPLSSHARLVQIRATLCPVPKGALDAWRAANEDSGEEILVFVNPKDKSVATSYFNLKDGLNKITFTQGEGRGQTKLATVQIRRN